LTSAHNVVSNAVSILNAGLAPGGVQMKVVGDGQSISGTSPVKISGLSVSVAASGIYEIQAMLMHSMSGVSIFGHVMSNSATTFANAALGWVGNLSVGTGVSAISTLVQARGWFNEAGFGSVTYSVLATNNGNLQTRLNGIIAVSTTGGSLQLKTKAGASGCITIKPGSFLRAFKIA
jgi:hypothetical protein